jgi:hypothetical protein
MLSKTQRQLRSASNAADKTSEALNVISPTIRYVGIHVRKLVGIIIDQRRGDRHKAQKRWFVRRRRLPFALSRCAAPAPIGTESTAAGRERRLALFSFTRARSHGSALSFRTEPFGSVRSALIPARRR